MINLQSRVSITSHKFVKFQNHCDVGREEKIGFILEILVELGKNKNLGKNNKGKKGYDHRSQAGS